MTDFGGRCPYLSVRLLLIWQALQDLVTDRMVVCIPVHYIAAFAAFVGMLALLAVIERNARAMGKAGIQDMAGAIRKARSSAGRRLQ